MPEAHPFDSFPVCRLYVRLTDRFVLAGIGLVAMDDLPDVGAIVQ
jgi:hypothetical protein